MNARALGRSIAVAVLLAAGLPAAAGAADSPAIAVGAGGTAHLAWHQVDGRSGLVQERRRAADGTLTEAQYVSNAGRGAEDVRIGADRSGNAIMAWIASDGAVHAVFTRRRAADGGLGPVQRISPAGIGAGGAQLAVDASGNAVYAWLDDRGTIRVRRRAADGTLSPVQAVSGTGGIAYRPQLGIDAAGNALIVWVRLGQSDSAGTLYLRRRAVDGTLGPLQTLATAASAAYDLAVAGDGRAAVTWEYPRGSDTLIRGRTRAANGTLNPAQTLSPADRRSFTPSVAIDPSGRALFTWLRFEPFPETYDVEGRVRSAAGALGNRFFLGSGYSSADPRVEVDVNGNALFAWATDAFAAGGAHRIQARRRTPAGAMSATQDISTPDANALDPALGFDANGAAVIAWTEHGSSETVHARRRTALGELSPIAKLSE